MPPKKKGGKKEDDWDDVETNASKKMAALKVTESAFQDESDEDEPVKPKAKPKGRAGMSALLMMEDEEEEKSEKSEKSEPEDEPVKPLPAPKAEAANKDKKAKNKGKKGKNKQTAEDDELDALLENLNKPVEATAGKKKEKVPSDAAQVAEEGETKELEPTPDKEVEDKKKSKKKKKAKDKEAEEQTEDAEKKEEEDDEGEAKEGDEDAADDKKKKKKGKKDEKPKKKNKQAEAIKEMLRRKEEAELEAKRLAQEEEERFLAAEKKREEEARLEKEKRDAEKLRKKQREEQLKKEGKWLTPAQRAKQQQARARFGAQFDKIKEEAQTKKVVYEDLNKKKQQQQKEREARLAATASNAEEPSKEEPVVEAIDEKEDVDLEQKEEEALDDWELADVEDKKKETEVKAKDVRKDDQKAEESAESDEEEESSEEESDESDEDETETEESSSEEENVKEKETKEMKMERIRQRLRQRREKAIAAKDLENLRAPVICVLGHVDTGKTKMLDTIRRTNVQDGEAGGITQQIGATQVPKEAIIERCRQVRDFRPADMKIPGFLIIDTPGHESFANLRSRGSSLCDFAILVVDLMHGLEQQTIESIKLLVKRHTPFVVALNKIDRLHQYESSPRKDVYLHLGTQENNVKLEFKKRYEEVMVQFAEQGLNVCLSNDKKKMADPDYIPMVPTSAFCGDGIGNLMAFIAEMAQSKYADKLAFIEELEATVMEVKAIPGLGTTIDVILVNGRLKTNDIIVLSGTDGPIVTQIRDLKMPEPLRELRVKSEYRSFREIKGAQGIKVLAKGLEKALAGLSLYVVQQADEVDVLQAECEAALSKALTSIKKKPEGVYVQASTLGSLEALLEFLKTQKIPYANVNIGPVHKKDVNKALAMKQHREEYACILAFDVKIEREAQQSADREGVRIFQADIIYHLEDEFLKYREELRQKARREHEHLAVFPCKLRVLPQHVFNARNPIVCGVSIEAGQLKKGAPICVPSKECIFLGNVASIERNHEEVGLAKAGEEVCIKIENTTGEAPKLYGRHFTHEDILVSRLSRESIDACKAYFRDDLTKADWQLVIELKKTLDIL